MEHRIADDLGPLLRGEGGQPAPGRQDEGALHHGRRPLRVQDGDERLPDAELGDRLHDIELRVRPERLGGGLDRLLIVDGERAQGVLHPVSQLAEDPVGDVRRILCDEIHSHAFRADEPHHLLDLFEEPLRRVREKEVRLVEEEDEDGFLRVPRLGELFEELGEEVEQERGVKPRGGHEPGGDEDVDHAAAGGIGLKEVLQVERGLAEEPVRSLFLQREEPALDRPDARGGDVAVRGPELPGVVPDELRHRPQVLQVQQEKAVVVRDPEDEGQHAGLDVVQVEDPPEEERPHLRDGGPHGVPLLPEEVPEGDGIPQVFESVQFELRRPFHDFRVVAPRPRDPGQVPLHVRKEDRNADGAELFRQHPQRDGLAGARGSGDQAVPVGHPGEQRDLLLSLGDRERRRCEGHRSTSWRVVERTADSAILHHKGRFEFPRSRRLRGIVFKALCPVFHPTISRRRTC